MAQYQVALRLKSDYAEAFYNLGIAFNEQGRLAEAVARYQESLRLKPDFAVAHWNIALTWLLAGDFERGWPEYEWRWQWKDFPSSKRSFSQPLWDGSSLAGRTILLHAEQGLGDTIQFIRYAPLVKSSGGTVILECHPALLRLLQSCAGVDRLLAKGSSLPRFDVHAPLLSLPGILGTTLSTIPAEAPYLFADPELVRWWSGEVVKERQGDRETRRQGEGSADHHITSAKSCLPVSLSPCLPVFEREFKIGITWQGNPIHKKDKQRSIPLSYFEPLARLEGIRLFSLQKGTGSEQLAQNAGRFTIADLGIRLETFMDTAAVLKNLDLVVACDTAVVHLAGALGIPVWVALPFAPDWRWLLDRDDSPWYPTMRLFRQKRWGDWDEVLQRITEEVQKLLPVHGEQGTGTSLTRPGIMATISEALAVAVQYHQSGNLAHAEAIYRQVLQAVPSHAGALHLMGVLVYQKGSHDAAIQYLRQSLISDPSDACCHCYLGLAYRAVGKMDEALASYQQALHLKPDYAEAHNNLGNVLRDQGQLAQAVARYQDAIHFKPDFAEAHNNLGNALQEQGQLAEVVTQYQEALRLKPDYAEAHNNLGIALKDQGQLAEAVTQYQEALRLKPDYAEAHNNLGIALKDQGQLAEVVSQYQEALRLKPDYAEAHYNLAMAWLLAGDFERGWPEYEWRWQSKGFPSSKRSFPQPLWDGSSLAGRTILLHAEQGLGDTIQFIRYAPLVKRRGGTVILECQPALLRLLQSCAGVDRLLAKGSSLPHFDVYAPLLSLPGILGTTLSTIPAEVPYLFANANLVEHWRQELSRMRGFKIGIAWQGSLQYKADRQRSCRRAVFAPLARLEGVHLISLQKGTGAEQVADDANQFSVTDLGSDFDEVSGPFMDTAAVMQQLNLVVSVDTAVAHCAGALGVPVWVALPFAPHWTWMLQRENSPWYPTMRLFRQRHWGDWDEVFGASRRK